MTTVLDRFRLDDQVAIVTGASSGLGVAFAKALAEAGANLVLAARRAERLEATRAAVEQVGRRAISVAADVAIPENAQAIADAAIKEFGRIDVLVNNAGKGTAVPATRETPAQFREVIDINLRSVYRCLRVQLPHLYARGGGSIVNVASATLFGASPGPGPYAASKMGVLGLSKVASKEAGRRNVRVNVVAPGRTSTPLFRSHASGDSPEDAAALVAPIPLGRFAEPAELAQAIVFLCSDRASFINGSTLVVDGGRTG